MDPSQPPQPPPQQQSPPSQLQNHVHPPPDTPQQNAARKRKKTDPDEAQSPSEPRRLRRSHEACARCRSKKIKCDSKHPRCTACATAGTPCHQEDRHRQTLTPRGHTERIEHQLAQCDALLKRYISGFDLANLDDILAREGIDVNSVNPTAAFTFAPPGPSAGRPFRNDPPKGYPFPPPQHMVPPGYPMPMGYGPPGQPYPHMQMSYLPPFQHQGPIPPQAPTPAPAPAAPAPAPRPPISNDIKGQDPQSNDMSNTQALAKSFGVSIAIVNDLRLGPATVDKEDLAVGSSGLSSGRDRDVQETTTPRDIAKWVSVSVRRNSISLSPSTLELGPPSIAPTVDVWLPKDRKMVKHIVEVYFTRLNIHRPVFDRAEFERILEDLYDGQTVHHDPGFVCSLYLVFALGTLSELNHRANQMDKDGRSIDGPIVARKLMPHDWPEHDEFFERALSVKPDLRVTISSLQALILLHLYLYTERQGRTLWRLVGSLVRIAIELGLHHDPTTQKTLISHDRPDEFQPTFTTEECQLRIRLWGIVMVHDRGTSILLGRPLAIAPSDSNTPLPTRLRTPSEFSEHFLLSHPIAEIQADIITSLYTPKRLTGTQVMQQATRIIRRMVDFRKGLPESYQWYFAGTNDWPVERKIKLVQEITEDQGLTLLKIGIARILLLRALFSSHEMTYKQRLNALVDAITTSHNIIVVHNQLIRFPDIAFFTSPIPLHIAAMVILYGHMSRCFCLTKQIAIEDIWLALDMLPRFRWRWERKDVNGGHPLIAKLAEHVMNVNLRTVTPANPPVLMPEPEWNADDLSPPQSSTHLTPPDASTPTAGASTSNGGGGGRSAQSTPTMSNSSSYAQGYGPPAPVGGANGSGHSSTQGSGTPPDRHLLDVPAGLFYPFYPETPVAFPMGTRVPGDASAASGQASTSSGHQQEYSQLLAAAAAPYALQSQDSYMSEERDASYRGHGAMQMWMSTPGPRGMPTYSMPPPP